MRKSISTVAMALTVVGLAIGGLAAPAMVTSARAQSPYSYLPRRLTSGDMDILQAEAAKLGPNGPKEEGWHNPKSGNSGVVTFLGADTEKGLACRKFRYTFHTGTAQDGSPYTLNWCQTSAGLWAIAN
jgi:hypothetical protein